MPYPFLTPEETRDGGGLKARSSGPVPGLRVVCYARNVKFFFPGATADAAMVLARAALLDGTLEHPKTEVVFGTKDGPVWCDEKFVKEAEGVARPVDRLGVPTLITRS